jgi:hypothetical protein
MSEEEYVIDPETDELLILIMQDRIYSLRDEWRKADKIAKEKRKDSDDARDTADYLYKKINAVVKFLNYYNSDATDNWLAEIGLEKEQ